MTVTFQCKLLLRLKFRLTIKKKFRTKDRGNNISLFKSNSESYVCQLRQLRGSIALQFS